MNKELVNIGVVGVGFMGQLLARVCAELPYVRLVSVVDKDEQILDRVSAKYEVKGYTDCEQMLERERLGGVIVATPEFVHRDPVIQAANRGLDVFVEKPLATDLVDAREMITACKKNSVNLMVGYILRFETCYVKLNEAVRGGNCGRLLTAYARRNAPIQEARRLGGRISVVNYIGVHDFDQILWYNPSRPVKVRARAVKGRVWEEYQTPDFVWTAVEFEDGSLGITETGWGLTEEWAQWDNPPQWASFGDVRMDVIGTEGKLSLDFNPMDVVGVDAEGWKFPDTRHWPTVYDRLTGAVKLEVEHFLHCVMHDCEPVVNGEDGFRSLELALAAEKSLELESEVELSLS